MSTLEFIANNEDDVDVARFILENVVLEQYAVTDVIYFSADII